MIMKNLFATILTGAALALATSCGPKYQEPVEASQVGFAVSFLKSVNAVSGKGENVIVSPYSAAVALSFAPQACRSCRASALQKQN